MSAIVIQGSSNSNGNTRAAVVSVLENYSSIPIVDLNTLNISPFDYNHLNQKDDFLPLIERILQHDLWILATPVYWYTMSATMKVFVDRFSDLLHLKKDLGRKLRGKKMFVLASYSTSLPKGFEDTFSQICDYLGMVYLGTSFICSDPNNPLSIDNNLQIQKAKALL